MTNRYLRKKIKITVEMSRFQIKPHALNLNLLRLAKILVSSTIRKYSSPILSLISIWIQGPKSFNPKIFSKLNLKLIYFQRHC